MNEFDFDTDLAEFVRLGNKITKEATQKQYERFFSEMTMLKLSRCVDLIWREYNE